jgi:hypothetical protein
MRIRFDSGFSAYGTGRDSAKTDLSLASSTVYANNLQLNV